MKTSRRCPKCDGQRIWAVTPAKVREKNQSQATSTPFGLYYQVRPERSAWEKFMSGSVMAVSAGQFSAYICSRCGFTEWYAPPDVVNEALARVAQHPDEGVSLIDSTTPAYR